MPRLVLGTVQFGLPYGVANVHGQMPREEAAEILALGAKVGLSILDTAIGYGESELVLGDIGIQAWRVITKLPKIPADCKNVQGWVREQVESSLKRMRIGALYALMLHRPVDLLGPQGPRLLKEIQRLKEEKIVSEIGISIYSPSELDLLMNAASFDMVQAPFNILDRSLLKNAHLARLRARGTKVHLRSIFLQGLLLLDQIRQSEKFPKWSSLWAGLSKYFTESQLSPVEVCLRFAFEAVDSDGVLVGVDSLSHFQQIIGIVGSIPDCSRIARGHENGLPVMPAEFDCEDADLINPSRWQH
jgi:aryl-alcohol dehydrogenase-like predicted oxidoreductase